MMVKSKDIIQEQWARYPNWFGSNQMTNFLLDYRVWFSIKAKVVPVVL